MSDVGRAPGPVIIGVGVLGVLLLGGVLAVRSVPGLGLIGWPGGQLSLTLPRYFSTVPLVLHAPWAHREFIFFSVLQLSARGPRQL